MGVTYTTARERDRRRPAFRSGSVRATRLLAGTAVVAALMLGLGSLGRSASFASTERERPVGAVVDLTAPAAPGDLEPIVATVFDNAIERRFVARTIYDAVTAGSIANDLSNVGSLSRIDVSAADVERLPAGSTLLARLQAARAAAIAAGRPSPAAIALLTSADLAALKPGLVVRSIETWRSALTWCLVAFFLAFAGVEAVWRFSRVDGDRVLLSCVLLLTSLGFLVMISRPDPLRDTMLVVRYTQGIVIGLVALLGASFVNIRRLSHLGLTYLPLVGALVLAAALAAFGTGPGGSGTRINLGPIQPVEAIRLLIVLFLAGYFARRWELLREVRGTHVRNVRLPAWIDVPRADHILPVAAGVAIALVLFFTLKDLGPALLVSLVFLAMFGVAHGRVGLVAAGVVVLLAGFYVGHVLGVSGTLTERVAMWQEPWANAVRGGDQLAQAAWALASGGVRGTAAGLGATRYIPAGHTDLVLASIAEELGVAGIAAVLVAVVVIAWRGFSITRRTSTDYGAFVALGMTLSLLAPALVVVAGMLGAVPLTGVVTPFLSYGGSAMTVNFIALGLLAACGADAPAAAPAQPFGVPLRRLQTTLIVIGAVLVAMWTRVQVVSADSILARPQLSQQADGGLRYQYNPRVLDAAQRMPRGAILDRNGLPMAGDAAVVQAAREAYGRIGVDVGAACGSGRERCYPLGGTAFHLVGDATTRSNWAATNSSYVERDAEGLLRGFDDHAELVRHRVPGHGESVALRRDYSALVPVVRHRWEPDDPGVRALLDRPRDVRLTVDARLQYRVAGILARAAQAARVSQAAAVVLDADTGEVLASVSYPWPGSPGSRPTVSVDPTFDRARYGLYPPGSTFKLVTAAAALRADPTLASMTFQCSRLPDNRVGARIQGWARPIRDDIHDHTPHGSIAMREAVARSCNAYFAQLAVQLGVETLAETAGAAGIALSPTSDARRLRDNLPHAGYGQGEVLATPLRMARVAAALGSDGVMREVPIVGASVPGVSTSFVSPSAAGLLAAAMRDAVTAGTGRQLAGHPWRIAGKTGTAEVDERAPHAWFVGFAPYGSATRRVAFAVVLENAGYGGVTAASAAGQIVSAAAALGLVR